MASPPDRFELTSAALEAWCKRQGYTYQEADGQLAVDYTILGQPAPLMFLPQLERGMVMLVLRLPFQVPADRAAAVIQGANALNASSFMGAWVLDDTKGELYFRATAVALDASYTDAALLHVARVVVGTSELAAPAFRAIALDGADPGPAIAAVQRGR